MLHLVLIPLCYFVGHVADAAINAAIDAATNTAADDADAVDATDAEDDVADAAIKAGVPEFGMVYWPGFVSWLFVKYLNFNLDVLELVKVLIPQNNKL